jgi:hypothetical protein
MTYQVVNEKAALCVTGVHDRIRHVRGGNPSDQTPLKEWTYNGHIAVQRPLGQ